MDLQDILVVHVYLDILALVVKVSRDAGMEGAKGGARPPCPFSIGAGGVAKVPFYKVYFINVYMWTEPYHLSIVNHLLSTICSEIVAGLRRPLYKYNS